MLPFFTNPYPDELVYSAIARYHFYSGNIDYKDTLEEVFQSRSVIPSVEIGSHFFVLAQQLAPNYSLESLLSKHTIYPYYAPFLSKHRKKEILKDVLGAGQGLYTRLGMVAGGICKKDGLFYCPKCATNDVEQYGEPYIHREHQLQGIIYCAHHELILKKYPIDFSKSSRIEFIRLDKKLMNLSIPEEVESKEFITIQIALAKMAYQLLQVPIHHYCRESINLKYRALLRERNLITASNRIRQYELCNMFQSKFPKGFLEKYESAIVENDEFNWLKVITRNLKRHVHPFRHLLMLYSLEQDLNSFLQIEADTGPFGNGPWPCLNKAASHYKEFIIHEVNVTRDFKSKSPIGTFECPCGFVYSRKGPDRLPEDMYHIGRIKAFGDVWRFKLHQLATEGTYSTRTLARMLGVDSKTVIKYLSSEIKIEGHSEKSIPSKLLIYRKQLLKEMRQYPSYSRTKIRMCFPKEYMYLYRHDNEWLFGQLPIIQREKNNQVIVDWDSRDREYCSKVEKLYRELIELEIPVRVTISIIGRRLGILSNLEKHVDKLPKTKKLLLEIVESTQQFQIRRCCKIVDRILKDQESVALWKVQRIGGVKSHHFHQIIQYLEEYIRIKQEVESYEQTTG
ncbi:TnsD family Tn7-like transposition protein [Halalkalibacter akibai]|uniref:Tn7-like transposition protein D n=1 Tax=Halalkalibacter akibai (strain ATCC 43226 / DSM 21942 / CIP 109018 / JCM 9157 / 1139) TaxID=1236973 RepID=W4QYH3_HALA3|nr:TnsD family Tn7-like transposition protein [Halalkalibacter akibai]GAE37136.1 Tn7-like transposition protein D [Halalkalibacter akibai JCM 9157]